MAASPAQLQAWLRCLETLGAKAAELSAAVDQALGESDPLATRIGGLMCAADDCEQAIGELWRQAQKAPAVVVRLRTRACDAGNDLVSLQALR